MWIDIHAYMAFIPSLTSIAAQHAVRDPRFSQASTDISIKRELKNRLKSNEQLAEALVVSYQTNYNDANEQLKNAQMQLSKLEKIIANTKNLQGMSGRNSLQTVIDTLTQDMTQLSSQKRDYEKSQKQSHNILQTGIETRNRFIETLPTIRQHIRSKYITKDLLLIKPFNGRHIVYQNVPDYGQVRYVIDRNFWGLHVLARGDPLDSLPRTWEGPSRNNKIRLDLYKTKDVLPALYTQLEKLLKFIVEVISGDKYLIRQDNALRWEQNFLRVHFIDEESCNMFCQSSNYVNNHVPYDSYKPKFIDYFHILRHALCGLKIVNGRSV